MGVKLCKEQEDFFATLKHEVGEWKKQPTVPAQSVIKYISAPAANLPISAFATRHDLKLHNFKTTIAERKTQVSAKFVKHVPIELKAVGVTVRLSFEHFEFCFSAPIDDQKGTALTCTTFQLGSCEIVLAPSVPLEGLQVHSVVTCPLKRMSLKFNCSGSTISWEPLTEANVPHAKRKSWTGLFESESSSDNSDNFFRPIEILYSMNNLVNLEQCLAVLGKQLGALKEPEQQQVISCMQSEKNSSLTVRGIFDTYEVDTTLNQSEIMQSAVWTYLEWDRKILFGFNSEHS